MSSLFWLKDLITARAFSSYAQLRLINAEFRGIAQWQLNPTVEIIRVSHIETEINVKPTDEEVDLIWLAADAESLLDNARLMLGHMLLVKKAAEEPSKPQSFMGKTVYSCSKSNPLFWSYYNSTVIHLSMVSDRLRDLLIVSLSSKGIDTTSYNQ